MINIDYKMAGTKLGGEIDIPFGTTIDYGGLKIIGRGSKDWNLPIQENFIKIMDKVLTLEEMDALAVTEFKAALN